MTRLDKKIDEFLDEKKHALDAKNWTVYDEHGKPIFSDLGSGMCRRGNLSVLKALYGIDVETSPVVYCFRSEKDGANQGNLINQYSWQNNVMNGKIQDIIKAMMNGISGAVNDLAGYERYKSYSKCMAVPLFKYYAGSSFVITKLRLNTFALECCMDCFDWNGEGGISYDNNGDEHDRYHREIWERERPMCGIASADQMHRVMSEYLDENLSDVAYAVNEDGSRDYLMDIDDMDFEVIGFTMDISEISRRDLDFYYDEEGMWGYKFKRFASYKKDREVISTECDNAVCEFRKPRTVQLVRFLYLLRISGLSDKFEQVLNEILADRHQDIICLDELEKKAVGWVMEYLQGDVLQAELIAYDDVFNGTDKYGNYTNFQHWNLHQGRKGMAELLDRLQKLCFRDMVFYTWMRQMAEI